MMRIVACILVVAALAAPTRGAPSAPPPEDAFARAREIFRLAVVVAAAIPDPPRRAAELQWVLGVQARAGDRSGAASTSVVATRAALAIPSPSRRDFELSFVGIWQAEAGDVGGSLRTVSLIRDDSRKADVLYRMRKVGVNAAHLSEAIQIALNMKAGFSRDSTLASLSSAQADLSDMDGALDTASRIQATDYRSYALGHIAHTQVQEGDLEAALRTADRMDSPTYRGGILIRIARVQLGVGDIHRAIETADRLDENARFARGQILHDVALAQLNAGDLDGAATTFASIQVMSLKVEALGHLAPALSKAGRRAQALAALRQAREAALVEQDLWSRSYMLWEIAKGLSRVGDGTAAAETFREAFRAAAGMADGDRSRPEALAYVAQAQVETGDVGGAIQNILRIPESKSGDARDLWKWQALDAVRLAVMASGNVSLARRLVPIMHKHQSEDAALEMLSVAKAVAGDVKGAIDTAFRIRHAYERDATLSKVFDARLKAGDLWGALASASRISREPHRVTALVKVGILMGEGRNGGGARRVVDQALTIARGIKFGRPKTYALMDVAVAQALRGDRERAATTIRQAAAVAATTKDFVGWDELGMTWAQIGDARGALAWIGGMKPTPFKVYALAGIAQGLLSPLTPEAISRWKRL